MSPKPALTLNEALSEFERVEANLVGIERTWDRMKPLIPRGMEFSPGSGEATSYENARLVLRELIGSMPAIAGWELEDQTRDLHDIVQARVDCHQIGEFEALANVEQNALEQGKVIREYRFRFNRKRQQLVRAKLQSLISTIDQEVGHLLALAPDGAEGTSIVDPAFSSIEGDLEQIERVLGATPNRPRAWTNMLRHLRFAMPGDVRDIAGSDWPSIKKWAERAMYDPSEPLPVSISDLAEVAITDVEGPVATGLEWNALDAGSFERVLYEMLRDSDGYENVELLMNTNATDRGCDVSATRVLRDSLSGVRRERVIVQCKHWRRKAVGMAELTTLQQQVKLWEPPVVIAQAG